jgi:fucose permease
MRRPAVGYSRRMPRLVGSLDRSSRSLYRAFLANFALFGVTMTLVGATLPRLIRESGWSYSTSGIVLSAGSVGYFVTTFVTGLLVHRLGSRRVMVGGLLIELVGVALFARSPSAAVNAALHLLIGVGQGCSEVVTNFGVIRMEREGEGRLMSLLHAAFCVGGIVGPVAAGAYLSLTEGWGGLWRLVYPTAAVAVALAALVFARLEFPPEHLPERVPEPAAGAPRARRAFLSPLLALFAFMLLVYVSGEIGFTNWVSEYFVSRLGAGASSAALMVSVLWLGVLAGRLALGFWFARWRQDVTILGLAVLATASAALLLAARTVPGAAAAVFATGLGYSGVYPLVMSLIGRRFHSGKAVGIASTAGGIGSFASPFLIGYLGEIAGIGSAILWCVATSGLLALLALVVIALRPVPAFASARAKADRNTE